MPVPTNLLAALNGIALATTTQVPPDLGTLAMVEKLAIMAVGISPTYLAASTSATQVITLTPQANGNSATDDTYQDLNRQVATPPKNLGM